MWISLGFVSRSRQSPASALFEKELLTYLYLQHGGGEDETGWTRQGHVNFILTGQPAATDHYRRDSVATPAE